MRIISWFSCGAASAVATKLALAEYGDDVIVAYTEVIEEHPDNQRFLKDCENWFNKKILILRNEEYNGSIYEVFKRTKYLKGPTGAACTRLLKKQVRQDFERPGDIQVFGYTSEEQNRVDRFIDANNEVDIITPLIDHNLTKNDCLAMVKKAGIELPAMYKLGYKNNNCVGCVKGEAGYWNKIRIDFPDVFERMSKVEQILGRTVCKKEWKENGKRKLKRIPLVELDPKQGRYKSEPDISCGIFCLAAEYIYHEKEN